MGSAFCGAQSRLSLRQRLFPCLVDFDKTQTASQDSTPTPTEQAMLANRVLHCLEEEKSESKRYNASSFLYVVNGYKMKCQMQNDPNCHLILVRNTFACFCSYFPNSVLQYVCLCWIRITEQLRHWQDGDPEEYLSTPLFVPSSTLSMQTAMRLSPAAKTRVAAVTQVQLHLGFRVLCIFASNLPKTWLGNWRVAGSG